MSCYNPNVMSCKVDDTGELIWTFEGSGKFDNPLVFGSIDSLSTDGRYKTIIPCGKCYGCRCDYAKSWSDRMCMELKDNPRALFLTLTYRDSDLKFTRDGLPTLDKRDTQLFWKRLRKAFPSSKIRYYLAGEYGSRTMRPHYHAIVYGLDLDSFPDLVYRNCNELKNPFYSSAKLEKIWSHGFCLISSVSEKTCSYVARYTLKKHYGSDKKELGSRLPEFNLSSRRPGIGLLHAKDLVLSGNDLFPVPTSSGVAQVYLSKAFIRSALKDCSQIELDIISEIMYNRKRKGYERLRTNLIASNKSFYDYLLFQSKQHSKSLSLLPEREVIL